MPSDTPVKTVLCYGDSNTWGYKPPLGERHKYEDRWTTVLQRRLGPGYHVIPEGLNGRTTIFDDPIEEHRNGYTCLSPCLGSHKPLDLVILMLGTNDLKSVFTLSMDEITSGIGTLIDLIRKSAFGHDGGPPEVLLLIPPRIRKETDPDSVFAGGYEKSLLFSEKYRDIAEQKKVPFLDTDKIIAVSESDGIHYDPNQLLLLGNSVADKVLAMKI